ncbi:hypothetical protein LZ318_10880 [Saccharopolyspora indica]|uniref:methyltransferase n=1 Tax=Saccharopolyspora indica TaxID=1229659 RepID=UPI0022EB361D|nr:methyltransferase [Saccharopolyspora indica]MDA3645323.1 methyltransferase [Saccharopolyspora indica]
MSDEDHRYTEAVAADGRLLVVEPVLPDIAGPDAAEAFLSDVNMLVMTGGEERTRGDYERLARRAALTVSGVRALPPHTGYSLVEMTVS